MPGISKQPRQLKATREQKTQLRTMEKNSVFSYSLELEEEEESFLRPQTAVATPRAEEHWGGASTDEESGEKLEMTEGEDNAELSGNSGLCCAMTGDIAPQLVKRTRVP